MRRLLLYKTGQTDPALCGDIGDYERWFARLLDGTARFEIHHAFETPRHPLRGYDGMVVTGSPRSLVEPEPWMEEAAECVRAAACAGVPVLGVCFGHQLIGHAFGGRVRQNPNGWEAGTREVALTDDGRRDPLFRGLPERLSVNQSHRDELGLLSDQIRRLAWNAHSATQAIAVGDHVRGVQFHPEIDGTVIRRLMAHRRLILDADATRRGQAPGVVERLLRGATDTPDGARVLHNFVVEFVRAA